MNECEELEGSDFAKQNRIKIPKGRILFLKKSNNLIFTKIENNGKVYRKTFAKEYLSPKNELLMRLRLIDARIKRLETMK